MSALAVNFEDLHEPSAEDIGAARVAARQFAKFGGMGKPLNLVVEGSDGQAPASEPITVPANIFKAMVKMLIEMGNGNAVAIVPVQAELTTQQAADMLNVSRPHLIKLLERKDLDFRMVGTHRKVSARDVIAYRDKTDYARREALAMMVSQDECLGLYDDEPVGAKG